MKSARHQLILLGLVCQGLSADLYLLPLGLAAAWACCLALPRQPFRAGPWLEIGLLLAGTLAGKFLSEAAGRSGQFAVGYGLAAVQLVRLLRPLEPRERVFSLVIACGHVGVGCTFLFDLRFLAVLLAALVLVPRALFEMAREGFPPAPDHKLPQPAPGHYAIIFACLAGLYVFFPRGLLGNVMPRGGADDAETSLDSVLDISRMASAQSGRVLLQIEGEHLGYLRSMTLGRYDGRVWQADPGAFAWNLAREADPEAGPLWTRRVRVRQSAFLARILPTDRPAVSMSGNFFRWPYLDHQGIARSHQVWNTANNVYTFTVRPEPVATPLSRGEHAYYTRCPPQTERLRSWLDQVLAGARTPAEQARLLENHLRSHYRYNLGAPALREDAAVEDFLLETKEGHCARFAAALAVLLRMQDIPSRVVVGYVPSGQPYFSNWRTVRFRDAHAWVEAHLDGEGWVTLEATPASSLPRPGWRPGELWDELDLLWFSTVVSFDGAAQSRLWANLGAALRATGRHAAAGWRWGAAALALAGLGFLAWQVRQRLRGRPRAGWTRQQTVALADSYYGRMLRALARRGLVRQPHQTPAEVLAEAAQRQLPALEQMAYVTERFCALRYGDHPPTPEEQARLEAALHAIRSARQAAGGTPPATGGRPAKLPCGRS